MVKGSNLQGELIDNLRELRLEDEVTLETASGEDITGEVISLKKDEERTGKRCMVVRGTEYLWTVEQSYSFSPKAYKSELDIPTRVDRVTRHD